VGLLIREISFKILLTANPGYFGACKSIDPAQYCSPSWLAICHEPLNCSADSSNKLNTNV
jgi:hypothetical protein